MEAFQTGEDFSTLSTTDLFQRVEDLGGNKYYQDEQPTSSTIESPHLKKDVFNSEPLSTKEDNKGTLLVSKGKILSKQTYIWYVTSKENKQKKFSNLAGFLYK